MKIILLILHLLIFACLTNGQVVSEGLVGYFPFTDGSLSDISGYQNCILSTNGDSTYFLTEDRFGNPNYAIDFQGAVLNAGNISRDITTEITVSLWMKTLQNNEDVKFLINKYYCVEPPQGYILAFVSESVTFDGRDNTSKGYMRSGSSQTIINNDEWHHIVGLVRAQGIWELWIDGQKEGSNSYSTISALNHTSCKLGIAGHANNNDETTIYKGVLDDIKIYNRALDSLEINSLFAEVNPVSSFSEYNVNPLIPQCFPNPFPLSTTISYELKKSGLVSFNFFDQFGSQVDIISENQQQGLQKVIWTPKNLPDGIYYFRIEANEQVANGKVVLIK